MSIGVGEIVEGKVTGITKFAAFVALDAGGNGMVHISEIAHSFVNDIREHLTEGQSVSARVLDIGPGGKISLSIKKATAPPAQVRRPAARNAAPRRAPLKENLTFEDKLKQFMHESESKMSDLRQNERRGSRRGGR
ncbi:MAG: S1 RNA-binding domain-containing protein [Oscillospiraceae bacterium]|nr:S1 RNA-binding domain-containing protein [Oscillospiraceae bacterium]